MPNTCATCRWHDQTTYPRFAVSQMGLCRWRPPQSLPIPTGGTATYWPETHVTDWCGAWQARPEADGQPVAVPPVPPTREAGAGLSIEALHAKIAALEVRYAARASQPRDYERTGGLGGSGT